MGGGPKAVEIGRCLLDTTSGCVVDIKSVLLDIMLWLFARAGRSTGSGVLFQVLWTISSMKHYASVKESLGVIQWSSYNKEGQRSTCFITLEWWVFKSVAEMDLLCVFPDENVKAGVHQGHRCTLGSAHTWSHDSGHGRGPVRLCSVHGGRTGSGKRLAGR